MAERIRIKDIAELANVSVGTVDRVLHGRGGVSAESEAKVKEILKKLNYQPNMYASALASNKKHLFACLLPQHLKGEYWTEIETGIEKAVKNYSDFNVSTAIYYYDPFDYNSFAETAEKVIVGKPDGVILAPTSEKYTSPLTDELNAKEIPYIYIDSDMADDEKALSFFGQNSHQSGVFSAQMLSLLADGEIDNVVIIRKIYEGIVGSNQQERREVGFREYMGEHHPDCNIYELDLPVKQEQEDKEIMDSFFDRHPEVKLGITFNSKAYLVGEYLKKKGKEDFHMIGYDLLERNVKAMHEGYISFLIAQQPRLQGFKAIESLCDAMILKKKVKRVNFMPIDLLTKENVDYYYIN